MAFLLKYIKKKKVWIPLIIVMGLVAFGVYSASKPTPIEFSSAEVTRIDLVQSVEETGAVKAQTDLQYGWEIAGRLVAIYAEVGNMVTSGVVIAELESKVQQSRLAEAKSQLAAAQADLDLKLVGASPQEISTSEAAVLNADAALKQAKAAAAATVVAGDSDIANAEKAVLEAQSKIETQSDSDEQAVIDAYQDAVQDAKDALTDGLDVLVTIADLQETYDELSDGFPHSITLAVKKQNAVLLLLGQQTNGKRNSDVLLTYTGGARGEVNALTISSNQRDIDDALENLRFALDAVKDTSDIALTALNAENQATATDKASLNTARATIDTAITTILSAQQAITDAVIDEVSNVTTNNIALATAEQKLQNAKNIAAQNNAKAEADIVVAEAKLKQAEASHQELIAPPRGVDVASLRAEVARRAANLAVIQEDLEKTKLRALADGVVSRFDVEIGETVTANQEVLGIVSDELNIDVDISETDIAKVSVGDEVSVTLDAFGDDQVFSGEVRKIDPAETEISGVIYYKTTVHLSLKKDNGQGVRPGMTANVQIITEVKPDALVIPRRAVLTEDGQKMVRKVLDPSGVFELVPVETGLLGDDGLIEIVSGLTEGEQVVTFLKTE